MRKPKSNTDLIRKPSINQRKLMRMMNKIPDICPYCKQSDFHEFGDENGKAVVCKNCCRLLGHKS
jgi:hypothetical protein